MSNRYCTDEDLLKRGSTDLAHITPPHLAMAQGSDGSIAAGSMVLASDSSDFAASGVTGGRVVVVEAPPGTVGRLARESWRADRRVLISESASGLNLTTRNMGLPTGSGPSAGSPTANLSPLLFRVYSYDGPIADASDRIDAAIGLSGGNDPTEANRRRLAATLIVLKEFYWIAWRQENRDVFKAKFMELVQELKPLLEKEKADVIQGSTGGFAVGRIGCVTKRGPYPWERSR